MSRPTIVAPRIVARPGATAGARIIGGAPAPDVGPEEGDRAAGRLLLAEKTADERRLAGAVAAEQRVDGAARNGKRDAVDGGLAAGADGDAVDANDGLGAHALLLCSRPRRW